MKRLMSFVVAAGLLSVGCEKETPPEPEKSVESPPVPKPKPQKRKVVLPDLAPDEPKTEVEGPPTPVDFEEEADKTVHFENLEAELDRLEAEITGG